MSLIEKLQNDMKLALKNKDELRLSTIRLLLSSVSYARIEKGDELTDDEVCQVLAKEAKKRRESIEAAEHAGREDVAQREKAELAIINEYLPTQLDESEIETIARRVIEEVGAKDPKDRGKVMGRLMQEIRGRADGRVASEVVERILRG
ncbi:MAG: GatB/YqeY domain-containing protein [Armatimonadota bacterium]|nr:GatB/YqeY domain-containing protein [Armatimonadota bacterium]